MEVIFDMYLDQAIIKQYMEYAKASIVGRAIVGIDGLKPVQRRIIYTMSKMNLLGEDNAKCHRIVGQVMVYHPNGDSSIYEALTLMTQHYEGLNSPYITGKGNFGKRYSRDMKPAASRYSEARLSPICKELVDGLGDDAVDMVDNFDGTEKEPALLPVKFPTILVNSNAGIAVGVSSDIPSYSLTNVCTATKGMLDGTVDNEEKLADALGAPEFPTGGHFHTSRETLVRMCKTGRGSFTMTGDLQKYPDRIVITQLPFNTTVEDFYDALVDGVKERRINGVKDADKMIDKDGMSIIIQLKNGYKSNDVIMELLRYTPLRKKISFRTRVIIDDRCEEIGIYELLQKWIDFRRNCIGRVASHKYAVESKEAHLLETWEKIIGSIKEVVMMIASSTTDEAIMTLQSKYGLDELQCDYIMDMRIKSITTDKAKKSIENLAKIRENLKRYQEIINNVHERDLIIINDMNNIISKYGTANKTIKADEITEEQLEVPKVQVSDDVVAVVLTENGFLKRVTGLNNLTSKLEYEGDKEFRKWLMKNNEYLLVFDRFGTVHKILVDSIDMSRGALKDKITTLANIENLSDMIYIDACGDYSKYFNLIYPNGKGERITYDCAAGSRKQYKSVYDAVEPNRYFTTTENKFFLVTVRNKAAYCDLTNLGKLSNRKAFKVARLSPGDAYNRLVLYKDVPNPGLISLERYNKDYTVSIGNDILWIDPDKLKENEEIMKKVYEKYANNSDTTEEQASEE